MGAIKVHHLHVQCMENTAGILNDLRELAEDAERSGEYGDRASRFRNVCTELGAILEHDIEPEIILGKPVSWTKRIKQIAIGMGPGKQV